MIEDGPALNLRRMYKLTHQLLSIKNFNFENESVVGFVNMSFTPLSSDLKNIYINCQQCLIHRISINDSIEPVYSYSDPTLDICQDKGHLRHNIESFENCHKNVISEVNPENGKGEICILIPEELQSSILELKPFQVIIEFSLVKPKGGLKFVTKDSDGSPLEKVYLFSCRHENSSRLWFPCIDSYSEVCTWKLEFAVNRDDTTAVSCGELTETVYSSDSRQKIYHYYLSVPTAAPNIALALGEFDVWVDPNRKNVMHYCCVPELSGVMRNSVSFVHSVFECYEELLSTRYPYPCYKHVFVDKAYKDISSYATMTICSINLLHSKKVIEQTIITQKLLSKAIAQQFFGCYISRNSWNDAWLTKGLSSLLSSWFQASVFGLTNRVYEAAMDMRKVCEYELNTKPVLLDPSKNSPRTPENPRVLSSAYLDIYELKSSLVMRLLEKLIGREFVLQVMHNLLVLATNAAERSFTEVNSWSNMAVSTESFANRILLVAGRDISSFLNQWVYQGGAVVLVGSFNFNKKRNVLELELKQDLSSKNSLPYAGPVVVAVQELDGTFCRQFALEENKSRFDVGCHTKSRKQKKKKIPLWTGEEAEMNLDCMDPESPVLWVRIDPEMNLLRIVKLEQADFMWRYMLVHERCVVAQLQAIETLERFPSEDTRKALIRAVESEKFFPKIREAAAFGLMKVENHLKCPSSLMKIFESFFGDVDFPNVVRRNNFSHFQHYALQKALPLAISKLRSAEGVCSSETLRFLLDLIKYNNNSVNEFTDCYYKANLIDALTNTLAHAAIPAPLTRYGPCDDLLTSDTLEIFDEILLRLNMEKILPSHKFCITVSCLKAFRKLHSYRHLPCNPNLFKSYATEGNFIDVRLAAFALLADYVAASGNSEILNWMVDSIENDADPMLRFKVVQMLIENPPFKSLDSPLNTESLKERLWDLMNSGLSHDCRLRCAIIDLYKVLYTSKSFKYKEIPFIKEKKNSFFTSMDGGCSKYADGREFLKKRKAESPAREEKKLFRLNSWGDDLPGPSYMRDSCHSENSFDVFQTDEKKKDTSRSSSVFRGVESPEALKDKKERESNSTDFRVGGHREHQREQQQQQEDQQERQHATQAEESFRSNSSCSFPLRESSPKMERATFDCNETAEVPSHYAGHRQVSSLLSEDEDDFDDFECHDPHKQTSLPAENNWFFNEVESGGNYGSGLNLSSDSEEEEEGRLPSSDVEDKD